MERQKAKYATRQQALSSVQPNPPKAVLRSGGAEVPVAPSLPAIPLSRTESTPRKHGVEVERE